MKTKAYIVSVIVITVLTFAVFYNMKVSKTKIATFNFPDFTVEKLIRSNNNSWIDIESVKLHEAEKLTDYDMVLIRVHGASMTRKHLDAIKHAISDGVPVFATEQGNEAINSLKGRERAYIATLMENGSVKNYRSMLNYIRANIDKKLLFNKTYSEPVEIPSDYFFHLGQDQFFSTYQEYQAFYEKSGKYKKHAPRVALLSGNINMQNSNQEHMAAIINSLEKRGLNVYPIHSFGMKKLSMLQVVKPNLVINRPHGRLIMGGGESGTRLLKTLNVPVLSPVTVSELYEDWMNDKQGMKSGGLTSMSIVLPELDGAVVPFAVAAQFERNGRKLFDAIPVHTEKFCSMVEKFARLHTKENREKKVAIYYYKGTGKGAINAAGIEGVESLYNTLKTLQKNGYDLTGLPENAKALEALIEKQGSVLGPYALGAYDEFIKNGNPALVDVDTFYTWAREILPDALIEHMENQYGKAPGQYMSVEKDGKRYIAVARLTFGNVCILPQPLPALGENVDAITHGVEGAPTYPYVASYFWTRKSFKADALIHFGTHGSLEFIPGKQVALSENDWTDLLIGDMPHFYIYIINNIGEGIIAKRRSYATLITHLTAPFMQSELYDDLQILKNRIHSITHMEEGALKERYRETIAELARKQHVFSALSMDSTLKTLTDKEIERIHIYVEEIKDAKVNDGLYTLGQPYSNENLNNTARLMSIDPIRYSLAERDAIKGEIKREKLDNLSFIAHRYDNKTNQIIERALSGQSPETLFRSLISSKELTLLADAETAAMEEKRKYMQRIKQIINALPKKIPRFLDENGNIIPDDSMPKEKPGASSMMKRMAQAEPVSQETDSSSADQEFIMSLKSLKDAVYGIYAHRENLKKSTTSEQLSLIDALHGGYIEPSSGGDPIVNPQAVPTGRNFYAINPETTPTNEAWKVGKRLAENLLAAEFMSKGSYPEKISFTLWSTNFISSEGATIAQILYLLGVEPLRDGFGFIRSLRLIPEEKLGRSRIDVVVQTSGQLRDIAASRLALINRAIAMASEAEDNDHQNFVRQGFHDAEKHLLEKGFSPVDARKFARERIFGGINGNYGTGIRGMVEKSDSWQSQDAIAEQYIKNMGAMYSANGSQEWGQMREGVFEAALLNTSVVVQPRSSNTWGPLSLDHVYEFMGGMSAAVRHVTGNDPAAYFNDFRNTKRARIQELKEAIGVETNSTLFNPKYIAEMMKGQASSLAYFAEAFRNTFGWNSMKPSAIDPHIWDTYYDIYVKDAYDMGLHEIFIEKNPFALQEMTAVMLESARKKLWNASEEQLSTLAELHAKLVTEQSAGCSGFICDNPKLRAFITSKVDNILAQAYNNSIDIERQVQLDENERNKNVVLKKAQSETEEQPALQAESSDRHVLLLIAFVAVLVLSILWLGIKRRKS